MYQNIVIKHLWVIIVQMAVWAQQIIDSNNDGFVRTETEVLKEALVNDLGYGRNNLIKTGTTIN